MHIIQSAIQILPIILLMCLGYVLKKCHLFEQSHVNGFKKIIINVTLPALIFLALSQSQFELRYIYVYAAILFIWGSVLFAAKGLGRKAGFSSYYFPFLLASGEGSMFGFALYGAAFGMDHIQYFAVINMVNTFFFIFIVMPQLLQYRNGALSGRNRMRTLAASPMIWSAVLGLLAGTLGIQHVLQQGPLGEAIDRTFTLLSQPTIPIIALIMGFELNFSLRNWTAPVKTVFIRLLLFVPIGLLLNEVLINRWLHYGHLIQGAFLTVWLLPPSFSIPVFLKDTDAEGREYVMNTISISVILSFILFTLLV